VGSCERRAPSAPSRAAAQSLTVRPWTPSALTVGLGGGEGIRTPGTLASTAVFKTAAIDHSATPPSAGVANLGMGLKGFGAGRSSMLE
jgi:hypothetical protein